QPGKPVQNAFIERFNRTYRNELLDMYVFRNMDQVREMTWGWQMNYNFSRPQEALKNLTPVEFADTG
ncbi:MAG: transposase, partial [Bacteroidota bacterium]